MEKWEHAIWAAGAVCALAAAIRLAYSHLYPAFLAFLVAYGIRSAVLLPTPIGSTFYYGFWKATEPIFFLLIVFAVYEAYRNLCALYPRLGWLRTWVLNIALGLALLLAVLSLRWDLAAGGPGGPLTDFLLLERLVYSVLALFVGFVWLFFLRYPVDAGRNLSRHFGLLASFLVVEAASALAAILKPGAVATARINVAYLAGECICFAAWALLMRRASPQDITPLPAPSGALDRFDRASTEAQRLAREAFRR